MSDPGSSELSTPSQFLSLGLSVLLGPAATLINQGLMYMIDIWTCGPGPRAAIYIIPLFCLLVALAAGVASFMHWNAVHRGVEEERGGAATRTRFLALVGIGGSAISALLIIAQGMAAVVFQPCMRA